MSCLSELSMFFYNLGARSDSVYKVKTEEYTTTLTSVKSFLGFYIDNCILYNHLNKGLISFALVPWMQRQCPVNIRNHADLNCLCSHTL